MKVLLVGAGVIGTVYGAHLAAAGMDVTVLGHGERTEEVARDGLVAVDARDGTRTAARVEVAAGAGEETFELILISVRRDQLRPALEALGEPAGRPTILVFGNNPGGRAELGSGLPFVVRLGFPGIGGSLVGGVATYLRVAEQPTALEAVADPRLEKLAAVLRERGFAVQRLPDMEGWLAYHAVFVSCVGAAMIEHRIDPVLLGADRAALGRMRDAISEGFAALKRQGVRGLPGNLALLHHPLLRPLAIGYWSRSLRSSKGELYFAAHTRHASAEIEAIARDVLVRVEGLPRTEALRRQLDAIV